MDLTSKIFVSGHRGLVGSALYRRLCSLGYTNLIVRSHSELDLTDGAAVDSFFEKERPEYVFLVAAKVGGIQACLKEPCDFLVDNVRIELNVMRASHKYEVKKLLFVSSACIYPENAPQPISEESLLTDVLDVANEPYGIAKIVGVKACMAFNRQYETNFISVIPGNLYGPDDTKDLTKAHVIPAMLRKFVLAKWLNEGNWERLRQDVSIYPISKEPLSSDDDIVQALKGLGITHDSISIWGTGNAKREFLWSEDVADATIFIMNNIDAKCLDGFYPNCQLNIGTGKDISIKELSFLISTEISYKGKILFDASKPEGIPRRCMNVKRINDLGWKHKVSIAEGIKVLSNKYLNE